MSCARPKTMETKLPLAHATLRQGSGQASSMGVPMSCACPTTMENKLPSPMPLPAWERVRVRAASLLPSRIFEGPA
jgi:hypothetical protein